MSTPMDIAASIWDTGHLWQNGLAAVPVALVVAALCRWAPCRPTTRHLLWLVVLLMLLIPPTWIGGRARDAAVNGAAWVSGKAAGAWAMGEGWIARIGADRPTHDGTTQPEFGTHGGDGEKDPAVAGPSRADSLGPALTPRRALPTLMPEAKRPEPLLAEPKSELAGLTPIAPRGLTRERTEEKRPATRPMVSANLLGAVASPTLPKMDDRRPSGPAWKDLSRPSMPIKTAIVPEDEAVRTEKIVDEHAGLAIGPRLEARGLTGPTRDASPDRGLGSDPLSGLISNPISNSGSSSGSMSSASVPDGPAPDLARQAGPAAGLLASRVKALRDAIVAFPPIPSAIWAGGMAALIVAAGVRTWLQGRILRRATEAPADVRRMVTATAATLGLSRPPETWMVSDRISPMVWCGVKSRLLLPKELWAELDEVGRSAVVMHELAHLRRRDHWTCWAELIACTLYWWHPVAWWVRRRLRDEADLCCDAWVTALLPRERRVYAQALLETRKYISRSRWSEPAVGLSATGGGAKRFARRLTMVMSHRTRPGGSWTGVALAAVLAGAGLASGPIWACPPEEKEQAATPAAIVTVAGQADPTAISTPAPMPALAPMPAMTALPAMPGQAAHAARPARSARPARPARPARAPQAAMAPIAPLGAVAVTDATPAPNAMVAETAVDQPARDDSTFERHMKSRGQTDDRSRDLEALLETAGDRLEQLDGRLDSLRGLLTTMGEDRSPDCDVQQHECGDDCENECSCEPCNDACAGPCGEAHSEAVDVSGDGRALVVVVGGDGRVQVYRLADERTQELVAMLDEAEGPVVVRDGARVAVNGSDVNALVAERANAERARAMAAREAVRAATRERVQTKVNLYQRQAEAYRAAAEETRAKAQQIRERAVEMEQKAREMNDSAPSLPRSERRRVEADAERFAQQTEQLRDAAEEMNGQADELYDKARELADEATAQAAEAQAEEEQAAAEAAAEMSQMDGEEPAWAATAEPEWPTATIEVEEPTWTEPAEPEFATPEWTEESTDVEDPAAEATEDSAR